MLTLYIHGFGSCALSHKASLFKDYYTGKGLKFLAPTLSYNPKFAIETLCDIVELFDRKVNLIGSSLGGYYAIYLANRYKLKAALINPSVYPYETLSKYIPKALNYCDLSSFEWNQTHLNLLKNYEVHNPLPQYFMVLLQKGDKDLDYSQAARKFSRAKLIIEEGGSHSFEGIEHYFGDIEEFFVS